MLVFLKKYWLSIIWSIIIIIFCSLPNSNIPRNRIISIPHFDKIIHFGIYFILSLLILYETKIKIGKKKTVFIFTSIFSFVLGLLIEIEQHYLINSRTGDLYDLIADVLGTITGIIFFVLLTRLFKRYVVK